MTVTRLASISTAIACKVTIVALLAISPAQGGLLEKLFAPKADLWDRWAAHDPAATTKIDHSVWNKFLTTYVSENADGVNRVAYARVIDTDQAALSAYIADLEATPISRYDRNEQFAYWVNLYNALTVKVILNYYPVDTIHDIKISPGLITIGPWDKKLISIEDERLSLNDIEHRILRPIWRDPRIHYAVSCASIGCPNLQRTAFTAANADALLNTAARAYVNHPRGARLEKGKLVVSSIYEWYEEDFVDVDGGVIKHLQRYANPDLAAALTNGTNVEGHEYDWALNDEANS